MQQYALKDDHLEAKIGDILYVNLKGQQHIGKKRGFYCTYWPTQKRDKAGKTLKSGKFPGQYVEV